jgi:hypothetical protein
MNDGFWWTVCDFVLLVIAVVLGLWSLAESEKDPP